MIETLRITSIIAVLLASAVVVFPVFFGAGGNEEAEKFLNSPSAVEKFLTDSSRARSKASKDQISPLTKQAKAFALYLNPPAAPVSRSKVPRRARRGSKPSPKSVSVKFSLIGTSFHASDPNRSMALINQPGSGYSWVRQNSEVGHLLIEQVKDGSVMVNDGKKSIELTPVRKKHINLLKGASSPAETGQNSIISDSGMPGAAAASSRSPEQIIKDELLKTALGDIPSSTSKGRLGQLSEEKKEEMMRMRELLMNELSGDLPGIGTYLPGMGLDSGSLEELNKATALLRDKIIPGSRPSRIGPDEAKKLDNLGQKLRESQLSPDPNRAKAATSKIRRSPRRRSRKAK